MKKVLSLLMGGLFLFSACNKDKGSDLPEGMYAEIETNKGIILAALEFTKTPTTVANFVSLAEGNYNFVEAKYKDKPFYDGLTFHRVINEFMIQGGDPEGTGNGGPGYKFNDEIVSDLKHDKAGILSMANAGPGTNGSQFFITHNATPHLDGMHTVFGHVVEGQDVVNKIEQGDKIIKIKIIRSGDAAKKFDAPKVFKDGLEKDQKATEEKDQITAIATAETLARITDAKAKATKTASGLSYYIFEKGTGEKPKEGTDVQVDYAGYFENGLLFDTGIEEIANKYNAFDAQRKAMNQYGPIPFKYGSKTGLIPGFIEGIENLKFGDKALIFIPAHLAYGERGSGPIPPNTDLIFEIHLSK